MDSIRNELVIADFHLFRSGEIINMYSLRVANIHGQQSSLMVGFAFFSSLMLE